MKNTVSLIFVLSILLTFSCNNDEELPPTIMENSFPQVFIFEEIDFIPSDFFLINGNDIEEFTPETEELLEIDPYFLEMFQSEEVSYIFPIAEIILNEDFTATLKTVDEYTGEELSEDFPYEIDGDIVQIQLSADPVDIFVLTYNRENKQLLSCLQTDIFIHENRQFQAFLTQRCSSLNKEEIIEDLISDEMVNQTLQVNDTLVLNVSNAVMLLQE